MQLLRHVRPPKDEGTPVAPSPDSSDVCNPHIKQAATPGLHRTTTGSSYHKPPKWWRIYWFRGMWRDVKRRSPCYVSDFTEAWDYRVVPATIYMYFANILPALAFSLDMFSRTHNSYGVNEVLLSSVIASGVFSLLAAQPLTIVGVTGPITIFNYTVYDLMVPNGTNYFPFMCLIGLWAMVMHFFLAISNSCNGLKYVTRFSCDTFGFYVACVYLQKGIQVLTRQYASGNTPFYLSIMVALLVLIVAYGTGIIGGSKLFQRYVRKFIEDYGTPLTIIFFTGFVHIGHIRSVKLQTLPTTKAFAPTMDRGWFIDFWHVKASDVGIAFPFAVVLTILFWFDHNVSSLIAQGTEFPLRKPAGFHWDIFLLGLTTGITGLIGTPFPNGLIPQAPFHTAALCVTKQVRVINPVTGEPDAENRTERVVDHVVEQRVSNLAQGLLTLGTMTGPLLIVVGLIPQGVLAGLFFTMGCSALAGNGIVLKILYLCRDRHLTAVDDPLRAVERQSMIWVFVACELFFFGAAFAITQTIAAIGFPIILLAPIPFRTLFMPKFFRQDELAKLDAPTASAFTMESVGGLQDGLAPPMAGGGDKTSAQGHVMGGEKANEENVVASGAATTARETVKGEGMRHQKGKLSGNMSAEESQETMASQLGQDPYKL